mgnify:FL=1
MSSRRADAPALFAPCLLALSHTGHFGSGAWVVQSELLRQPGAKLYAGSMNERTNLRNRVVGLPR